MKWSKQGDPLKITGDWYGLNGHTLAVSHLRALETNDYDLDRRYIWKDGKLLAGPYTDLETAKTVAILLEG